MDLFDLFIKIKLDDQASKGIDTLSTKLNTGLKTAARVGAASVGAVSAAFVGLGKIGVNYNAQMEDYTTNFKVMLGSTESAIAKVEELKEMAAKTPFGMSDLADATQTLLSFQVPAEKTTDIMRMLGDVALGDKEKFKGLALAFGQVSSAGKLQGEDLNQMIERGFNPLNYIAARTGETMGELRDRMSKGAISVAEVEQAFRDATSEGGQFYNGLEEGAKTLNGLKSTLIDTINIKIGEFFADTTDKITELLPQVITFIENIDVGAVTEKLNNFKDTLVAALPVVAAAATTAATFKAAMEIKTIVSAAITVLKALKHATEMQTIAQLALNTATNANVILFLISALVGAVVALVTLWHTNEDFRNKVIEIWGNIKEFLSTAVDNIVEFFTVKIPNAIQNALEWLKNIPDQMREVGKNLLMGLWNGISDKIAWLKGKVTGVVDTIKSWFTGKDGFDEHSPSKWSAQVFRQLMAGGVVGLDEGAPQLMRGVGSVVDEVKNGFAPSTVEYSASTIGSRYAAERESGSMGGVNTIVVQSVLDGKIIGETAYNFAKNRKRALGVV